MKKNMKTCSTADLREKEIINLCDGSRLGYADDFEFDLCDGKITALILCGERGLWGFGTKGNDLLIPWNKIECIGEETVLVRLDPNQPPYCDFCRRQQKKAKFI